MHVAVINRPFDPLSLRIYQIQMLRSLGSRGVEVSLIEENGRPPTGCDLLWDPAMCMRPMANAFFQTDLPLVGSMHGVKGFSLPFEELTTSTAHRQELVALKALLTRQWEELGNRFAAVTAPSQYGVEEFERAFGFPSEKVYRIPHGVDHSIFHPDVEPAELAGRYFLWVARLDPIKNPWNLIEAYARMPVCHRPGLVALVEPEQDFPDLRERFYNEAKAAGIQIIDGPKRQEEVARLLRGALALVFPSLRETFGLPILEAMACGCPVITSHDTSCAETAGTAALLVDPRSSKAISDAMTRVAGDEDLRHALANKGIQRAAPFAWQTAGDRLLELMQAALPSNRRRPVVRKVEITTTASCKVACHFCPQVAYRNGYLRKDHARTLSLENFERILLKLQPRIGISFGGMTEPFQNPDCLAMIVKAKKRGHPLEIFTTLVDFDSGDWSCLVGLLQPQKDRLYVHLPSSGNIEKIPVTGSYLGMLRALITSLEPITFHYHGDRLHRQLEKLDFGDRLEHWPIHDRAHYEARMLRQSDRKSGSVACVMNLEVPVMLPNGDLVMCSQDFGAEYVIGNLIDDSLEDIFQGPRIDQILAAMADDGQEIMCRYCHFAIQEPSAAAPS